MNGGPKQIVRRVARDILGAGERSGRLVLDSESRAQLETKIVDAFEAGRVHDAVLLFTGRGQDAESRRALTRIMDSALLTLGVTVQAARDAWFSELSKLSQKLEAGAQPSSPRESPVRDAFRGISVPLAPATSTVLRSLALVKVRFDASLAHAMADPDPLLALRKLADGITPNTLPDSSLMALLERFADLESFKDVVKLYERAPPGFQGYPAPKREYALALHFLGNDPGARTVLLDLIQQQHADPVVAGLLGKLDKADADKRLRGGDTAGSRMLLERALRGYQQGFEMDCTQLYPGVNIPGLLHALGRHKEASASARTFLALAELRASYGERNFFDATAGLEMTLLLEDHGSARAWLQKAANAGSEPWQRRSVIAGLERLESSMESQGQNTGEVKKAIQVLSKLGGSRPAVPALGAESEATRLLAEVQKVTYRFGAQHARRLTGNYALSGIAHDVRVTPADLRFFTRIVEDEGWLSNSNPRTVSKAIDGLIRARFGTEKLEQASSPEHKVFDQTMPGIARFMGAKENSQTNVSADWLNGLGDCRQHAPTKMLLFEAWKRGRTDQLIERLHTAHHEGDPVKAEALREGLFGLARYEMRVMDALIADRGDGEMLEEHTLTVLSKRKPRGPDGVMKELDVLRLADSFYHGVHALAGGALAVSLTESGLALGVPKPSADGRQVVLLPAPYSRDRSVSSPDFGQLEFRGVQVATPGWEREVPTGGLDLTELHTYARGNH